MAEIVVADAGPLIAFGRLDKLPLLGAIFDSVIVPQAVYEETQSRPALPDALAIRAAVQSGSLTVVPSAPERADLPLEIELGDGEGAGWVFDDALAGPTGTPDDARRGSRSVGDWSPFSPSTTSAFVEPHEQSLVAATS